MYIIHNACNDFMYEYIFIYKTILNILYNLKYVLIVLITFTYSLYDFKVTFKCTV